MISDCLLRLQRESFPILLHLLLLINLPLYCPELHMVADFLVLVLVEDVVGDESPVPSLNLLILGHKVAIIVPEVW